MDTILASLKQRRDDLVERSTTVAQRTRKRSVDVLGKVQSSASAWQRNVATEAARVGKEEPRWFRFVTLRTRILSRADALLGRFAEELRARLIRLRALELPRGGKRKTSTKRKAANGNGSRKLVLPIADYETLSAKEVLAEIPRLSPAQAKTVFEHETAHKQRKTVLNALESRLPS
jgi:hypothetical protein